MFWCANIYAAAVFASYTQQKTSQEGSDRHSFDTSEDLDFTDNFSLLSHTHQHMQEKAHRLGKFSQQVGQLISKRKTEFMTLNVNAPAPVLLDDQALPSTEPLPINLGSFVKQNRGTDKDIQSRLSKARSAFRESECSLEAITVQHQD